MDSFNFDNNDKPQYRDCNIFDLHNSGHSVADIDINDVAPANLGLDRAYRSIDVFQHSALHSDYNYSPTSVQLSSSTSFQFIYPPASKKSAYESRELSLEDDLLSDDDLSRDSAVPIVPSKPRHLLTNNFITMLSLASVINLITDRLNETADVCVRYVEHQFKWEVFFLKASVTCKIEVRLYRSGNNDCDGYIIEANRLSGCCRYFRGFYHDLKSEFSARSWDKEETLSRTSEVVPSLLVSQLHPLADSEAVKELLPVVAMLQSDMKNQQAQACQLLCLLSPQEELHNALVESGCVHALVDCLATNSPSPNSSLSEGSLPTHDHRHSVDQHAILAIAKLSEYMLTEEYILSSSASAKLVRCLLDLCRDGPYHTAEMRREGARTLKNLCKRNSKRVLSTLQDNPRTFENWKASIDNLLDARLKMQALEAAKYLSISV